MFLGRWEVRIPNKCGYGPDSFKVCRLHSLKRAEERAKYNHGWVVDRKMYRCW